ncbi:hypothetical protein BaRGS_00026326 [Batillaria attramentaria]|uniref:Uncharacterized protein n=1 Tax=Batillaria attramentaria TaxID=370345 RepID=A0ABD0K5A1_9CAEN
MCRNSFQQFADILFLAFGRHAGTSTHPQSVFEIQTFGANSHRKVKVANVNTNGKNGLSPPPAKAPDLPARASISHGTCSATSPACLPPLPPATRLDIGKLSLEGLL